MTDFAPPTGPPPPKVPEGWKAVWNDQYSEYFYVNIYTKQSQWDKPTEPVYPAGEGPPTGAPPSYIPPASGAVGSHATGTSEKSNFSSNNPYANVGGAPPTSSMTEDEKYARKLQDEEEARARSHGPGGGASNDYYSQSGQPQPGQYGGYPHQGSSPYPQSSTPMHDQPQERGKSKGLLGKLKDKVQGHSSGSSHGYPQQSHYQQPSYGHGPPVGGMGGGHYGGQPGYYQQPGRPMMGGGMMGGGRRPGGGGMGAGGAMALGAGGGLLGGALLGSAMADGGDGGDTYIENNYGDGDMGGDMGDMGDMGGDF